MHSTRLMFKWDPGIYRDEHTVNFVKGRTGEWEHAIYQFLNTVINIQECQIFVILTARYLDWASGLSVSLLALSSSCTIEA